MINHVWEAMPSAQGTISTSKIAQNKWEEHKEFLAEMYDLDTFEVDNGNGHTTYAFRQDQVDVQHTNKLISEIDCCNAWVVLDVNGHVTLCTPKSHDAQELLNTSPVNNGVQYLDDAIKHHKA